MTSLSFKQENKGIFGYCEKYEIKKEYSKAWTGHISSHKKNPVPG
jgi:hypothetical protein